MLAAASTEEMGEPSRQDPAIEEVVQLVGHETGQRATVGLVGPLLLEGQKVLLQHLVEDSLLGLPA